MREDRLAWPLQYCWSYFWLYMWEFSVVFGSHYFWDHMFFFSRVANSG